MSCTASIPVSQLSRPSTANRNAAARTPRGTFNGGTPFRIHIGRKTFVKDCFANPKANTAQVPAGGFAGRVVFTVVVP